MAEVTFADIQNRRIGWGNLRFYALKMVAKRKGIVVPDTHLNDRGYLIGALLDAEFGHTAVDAWFLGEEPEEMIRW